MIPPATVKDDNSDGLKKKLENLRDSVAEYEEVLIQRGQSPNGVAKMKGLVDKLIESHGYDIGPSLHRFSDLLDQQDEKPS